MAHYAIITGVDHTESLCNTVTIDNAVTIGAVFQWRASPLVSMAE